MVLLRLVLSIVAKERTPADIARIVLLLRLRNRSAVAVLNMSMLPVPFHLVDSLLASAGWARYSPFIDIWRRAMIVASPIVVIDVLGGSSSAANREQKPGDHRGEQHFSKHMNLPRRHYRLFSMAAFAK